MLPVSAPRTPPPGAESHAALVPVAPAAASAPPVTQVEALRQLHLEDLLPLRQPMDLRGDALEQLVRACAPTGTMAMRFGSRISMKRSPTHTETTGIAALEVALTLAGRAGRLRPARAEDLKRATKAGFPRELIGFYRKYEPEAKEEYVELEDRLYSLSRTFREIRPGSCGGKLFSEGFIPFAGTRSGDFYCFDTNMATGDDVHPIVFFDKEAVQRAADSIDIWAARSEVALSLDDFFFRFASMALGRTESTVADQTPVTLPEPAAGKSGLQLFKAALRLTGQQEVVRPATAADLKRAERAGFPTELLRFYSKYEPDPRDGYVEFDQRLYSIKRSLQENRECVPGVGLFPHGYVVFAGTSSGDSYCVDTNVKGKRGVHPIVLFSHESIGEHTDPLDIQAKRLEVASSLDDFLRKFSSGQLVEDPQYPSADI